MSLGDVCAMGKVERERKAAEEARVAAAAAEPAAAVAAFKELMVAQVELDASYILIINR